MNSLTHEQQLWLAKQLHLVIIHTANKPKEIGLFHWTGTPNEVTPQEWHSIVAMVEGKLNTEQLYEYVNELDNALHAGSRIRKSFLPNMVTATPPQRTTALMKVLR